MGVMERRRALMMLGSDRADLLMNAVWVEGEYYNASGSISSNGQLKRIDTYVPVIPHAEYVLSGHAISAYSYDRIVGYNDNKVYNNQVARLDWPAGDFESSIIIPNDCYYIRLSTEKTTEVHMYLK